MVTSACGGDDDAGTVCLIYGRTSQGGVCVCLCRLKCLFVMLMCISFSFCRVCVRERGDFIYRYVYLLWCELVSVYVCIMQVCVCTRKVKLHRNRLLIASNA